jgi:hypothetical protein
LSGYGDFRTHKQIKTHWTCHTDIIIITATVLAATGLAATEGITDITAMGITAMGTVLGI